MLVHVQNKCIINSMFFTPSFSALKEEWSEKLINGLFIGYFPPIFITKLPILIKMRYKLQIKSQETSTF